MPERIARLLDACLAFSPEQRPETGELAIALRDALETTLPDLNRVAVP